ncbi:MAG: bifunctional 5,10-methylenetetrahydrofolate dehydrogenase/5,10-methenyltetrahydrofolate cyclohydrolase [Brevinema sp.]
MNNNFILLDGVNLSDQYNQILKQKISSLPVTLGLSTILVGEDIASKIYINAKIKACGLVGITSYPIYLPVDITEEQLIEKIEKLNRDDHVHGILVQLPLPTHINSASILSTIDPKKDVDAFHPYHMGNLMTGVSDFAPATPTGIMCLFDLLGDSWSLEGKRALVIGASNIVGKPTAALLLKHHSTVTIAHKYTTNLKELCLTSDVIISATGQPNLLTQDMVSEGTVLVDVGMSRIWDPLLKRYRLTGDIDFEQVSKKAFAITPVPGGVGPMTIAALMQNIYTLATHS